MTDDRERPNPPRPGDPTGAWSAVSVVGRTLDTLGARLPLFLVLSLPAAVVAGGISLVAPSLDVPGLVVGSLLAGLATLVSTIAAVVATHAIWTGRAATGRGVLTAAMPRSRAMLWAYLLLGILALFAWLLAAALTSAVDPALSLIGLVAMTAIIYVALRLTPVAQVVILERVRGTAALSRSWAVTRGHVWALVRTLLLVALIALPVSLGITLLTYATTEPLLPALGTFFATFVITPLVPIATTLAWARMAGESYPATIPGRVRASGRRVLAAVLGVGLAMAAAGLAEGSRAGWPGLQASLATLPGSDAKPGVIMAGTQNNPLDPCRPLDQKTTFATTDPLWMGGYLSRDIPPSEVATVEIFVDGELYERAELGDPELPTSCYYLTEPVTGTEPSSWHIVVRRGDETLAEGRWTVE
jgi:hypothetical protein